eukprot:g31287.t1
MSSMFFGATAFNMPIGEWNTSRVQSMSKMFFKATKFNQPIGSWKTAAVVDMSLMFCGATRNPISWFASSAQQEELPGMTSATRAQQDMPQKGPQNVQLVLPEKSRTTAALTARLVLRETALLQWYHADEATKLQLPHGAPGGWDVSSVTNMKLGSELAKRELVKCQKL